MDLDHIEIFFHPLFLLLEGYEWQPLDAIKTDEEFISIIFFCTEHVEMFMDSIWRHTDEDLRSRMLNTESEDEKVWDIFGTAERNTEVEDGNSPSILVHSVVRIPYSDYELMVKALRLADQVYASESDPDRIFN